MMLKGVEEQNGPMPSVMQPPPISLLLIAVGLVWAGLELAAGITTLRRKAVGRSLHIIYGAGAVLMNTLSLFFQWQQHNVQMEWARNNADNAWAKQMGNGQIGFLIGLLFGIVLGYSWPVFCLIWFGLLKKRPEAGWVEPELDAI